MTNASPTPPDEEILLVDDDQAFRQSTARTLEANGHQCHQASTAAQAREVLGAQPSIALMLCDIRMPGGSGLELLAQVVLDLPDLAVVMTTGLDDPSVAHRAFEIGAFGYLVKPFAQNELLIGVASALKRRHLELVQRSQVRALEGTLARTRTLGGVLDLLEVPGSSPGSDDELIERLSRALSLRDEETGRHIERMSRYSAVVAEAVAFADLSPDDLRMATALHDVGKIGIPDGILLKPAALTGDEYATMQRHAHIGYQLISGSRSPLLRTAGDIALSHHEWWDGGGYPRGMAGPDIPEEARIAAITDVFDALTSHRVYRAALSVEESLDLMLGLRGTQFEPRLLDAFVEALDEILAIRAQYPDIEDEGRIRTLVVDDEDIFAQSLVRLLATKPQIKVVGVAGTVASAIEAARSYEPDVVLLDFELPDGDGAQAADQITSLLPHTKVVMLTGRSDHQAMARGIRAGCAGFVNKNQSVDTLMEAVRAAHEGEIFMAGELAPALRRLPPSRRGLGTTLTTRELEVLTYMASGLVNKQIARRLNISLNTIRNHVKSILHKLNAHSKLEAVATALREGIIELDHATGT